MYKCLCLKYVSGPLARFIFDMIVHHEECSMCQTYLSASFMSSQFLTVQSV